MSKITFTDGEEFELDVPLHMELRKDGWYVVGANQLQAVDTEEEGEELIVSWQENDHLRTRKQVKNK